MKAKAPAGMLNLDCVNNDGRLTLCFARFNPDLEACSAVNHGVKRDGFDNGHPTGIGLSYLSLAISGWP